VLAQVGQVLPQCADSERERRIVEGGSTNLRHQIHIFVAVCHGGQVKSICFLKFGSEVTELANLKAIAVMVKFATGGMLLVKRKPFLTLEHLNSFPRCRKAVFFAYKSMP
jgi:hypothetical protein